MTEWKEAEELLETEEEPLRRTVIVDKETESLRLDKLLGEVNDHFSFWSNLRSILAFTSAIS